MTVEIAIMDGLATCFFFAAGLMAMVGHRLSAGRTELWAYTSIAFGLFTIERGANALEWAGGDQFAALDDIQGYLSFLACIVIAALPLRFLLLTRRVAKKVT
jgi:hypothetical protein